MFERSVGVLEVGFGNLPSIERVLRQLNVKTRAMNGPEELLTEDYVIIPGVGSFKSAMTYLEENSLVEPLRKRCLELNLPTLGICLGGQILLTEGQEGGLRQGLGVFDGSVESLAKYGFNKSHTGWDEVHFTSECLGFSAKSKSDFYFNHDYFFAGVNPEDSIALCEATFPFVVSLRKNQTFAVQFHPEKSQKSGLLLLQSFLELHDL